MQMRRLAAERRDHLASQQFQLPHHVLVWHTGKVHAADQVIDAEGFLEALDLHNTLAMANSDPSRHDALRARPSRTPTPRRSKPRAMIARRDAHPRLE